jgi:nucleotide-binding universal stress UspA family protein
MNSKPYVVLVGMDFSELADRALEQAFELAAQREAAEVHVLCVVPGPSLQTHHGLTGYFLTSDAGVRDGVFESLRAHVQVEWDAFMLRSPDARTPARVMSHVRIDAPALGLVEVAAEVTADLIVLGAYGHHGETRLMLGSVAESTMRHAACPVLIVPLEKPQENRRSEPPWASLSVPPRSAAHQPSVRPRAP